MISESSKGCTKSLTTLMAESKNPLLFAVTVAGIIVVGGEVGTGVGAAAWDVTPDCSSELDNDAVDEELVISLLSFEFDPVTLTELSNGVSVSAVLHVVVVVVAVVVGVVVGLLAVVIDVGAGTLEVAVSTFIWFCCCCCGGCSLVLWIFELELSSITLLSLLSLILPPLLLVSTDRLVSLLVLLLSLLLLLVLPSTDGSQLIAIIAFRDSDSLSFELWLLVLSNVLSIHWVCSCETGTDCINGFAISTFALQTDVIVGFWIDISSVIVIELVWFVSFSVLAILISLLSISLLTTSSERIVWTSSCKLFK